MATQEMAFYCFDVLAHHLDSQQYPTIPAPAFENSEFPLFVTWNLKNVRNEQYHLRGCIGTFSPHKLHQGLEEFALTSAFRDSRFSAILMQELNRLQCSVSLLTDFEKATDCFDWEIGVHGIWIEFELESGRTVTATYLPQVMPEQGWDKEEALVSLLRKGGFRADVTAEKLKTIRLTRYQTSKVYVTYHEWEEARKLKS